MVSDFIRLVQDGCDPIRTGSWGLPAAMLGWAFLFALARMAGLLILCPIFSQRGISIWYRIGLSFCLAAVIAPLLFEQGLAVIPPDVWNGGVSLVSEFVIGALLGIGVLFIFAALKLAGELIDQQAGLAMQEVFDPSGSERSTVSGQLLVAMGTLCLLCAGPRHGFLQIMAALMDSCVTIPGSIVASGEGAVLWIAQLGGQSLSLALRVAAPVLAGGALVSWGIAWLTGRSGESPIGTTWLGIPARIVLSLLILAMGLTGMTDALMLQLEDLCLSFTELLRPA